MKFTDNMSKEGRRWNITSQFLTGAMRKQRKGAINQGRRRTSSPAGWKLEPITQEKRSPFGNPQLPSGTQCWRTRQLGQTQEYTTFQKNTETRWKIDSNIWANAAEWMNLRNMGKSKILKTIFCMISFIGESRRGNIIITESTSAVACDQDWEGD